MFTKNEVLQVLGQAANADKEFKLFGAEKHRYKLNPTMSVAVVRHIENQYNFSLPEDHSRFITEVGNGGAGPHYGLHDVGAGQGNHSYGACFDSESDAISLPFCPRPITEKEAVTHYSQGFYDHTKGKCYCYGADPEEPDSLLLCENGLLTLGTQGCAHDHVMVVSGERKGQVFSSDDFTSFVWKFDSFTAFYADFLDDLRTQRSPRIWHKT